MIQNNWNLKEVVLCKQSAGKAVYAAVSRQYGAVILKIDSDRAQLRSEYAMLSALHGRGCCKVYGFDPNSGSLLEERIIPGTPLREEPSLQTRIQALKSVFDRIHLPAGQGITYLDWLEQAFSSCTHAGAERKMLSDAEHALAICRELFARYPKRLLLHGDLHHDNILRRADGSYAVIDPKGVIGPPILDLPRFLLNEPDTIHTDPVELHMRKAAQEIAACFGYPVLDIGKAYYMETVLANLWCIEDGEAVNQDEIRLAENVYDNFLRQTV